MLAPNRNIWETRIQNVDALVTASHGARDEVYYLATACQVGLDPPRLSISPNPEYPICEAIEGAGYFGLHFLSEAQGGLVERTTALDRSRPDKLTALDLAHERTAHGTPLLADCIQAIECRVERAWDSGDHRTFIGIVTDRRVRPGFRDARPHRFGGSESAARRWLKRALCVTGGQGLIEAVRARRDGSVDIAEGTGRHLGGPSSAPPGVCLVGCGWWGGVHALELKRQGSRVRRFFASRDLERAREFARRFDGEDAFDGLEAALADARVDAVVLALPHHLHAPAAGAALAAGKHVLVEKPLALSAEQGEALVRQARDAGLCLAVAEQYRLSPLLVKARELVRSGALGAVSFAQAGSVARYRPQQTWKNARDRMGGGVLIDVGVHYVDLLRFLFGEPTRVWAAAPPRIDTRLEGEDGVAATLEFAGGPVASLCLSWSGHRSPDAPNLELIGEHGALALDFRVPWLRLSTPLPSGHWSRRLSAALPWRVERRVAAWLPRSRERRVRVDAGDLSGHRALLEDFLRAVRGGGPPSVSGAEGLRDLRVVLAAYAALESGRPVRFDETEPPAC